MKIVKSKKIGGYVSTILPALISFIQLFIFYKIDEINANTFYSMFALFSLLNGILAFNTNYVFLLRKAEKKLPKSEYTIIVLYRVTSFILVSIPILVYNFNNQAIIYYSFTKLFIEVINNYYRSDNNIYILTKNTIITFFIDIMAIIAIYFFNLDFLTPLIISGLISLTLISPKFIKNSLGLKDLKSLEKNIFKIYLNKIGPLSLSSIRENISSQGIIYFASKSLSTSSLSVLINGLKLYSLGILLINVLSNYYIQDYLRTKTHKYKDLIILSILIFTSTCMLHLLLKYSKIYNNVGNEIAFYLVALFIIGIFCQLFYYLFQAKKMMEKKFKSIYFFELVFIITIFLIFLVGKFEFFFLATLFSYLTSFTFYLILKNINHVLYWRNKRNII